MYHFTVLNTGKQLLLLSQNIVLLHSIFGLEITCFWIFFKWRKVKNKILHWDENVFAMCTQPFATLS